MTPEERIAKLEMTVSQLSQLIASDRYTVQKHIQMFDGRNMQLGLTTGTKIGTATTQKIGFYGVTPVVQPIAPATAAGIILRLQDLGLFST